MIELVVALGNPGSQYETTKHNIGWLVLDNFKQLDGTFWKSKFKGVYTDCNIGGQKVYFLKPETYMNLSGESVQALASFFKINVENILVIHDELDIPFGQLQFKKGGGLAGHNGLKSMNQCLGSKDFYRLRIGIGRPQHGDVSSWVLSGFGSELVTELEIVLSKSAEALGAFLKSGMRAANKYNKKDFLEIK